MLESIGTRLAAVQWIVTLIRVGMRIAEESERVLALAVIALGVFVLVGAGAAGARKSTSLNCRLHRATGPAPDLEQTAGAIALPRGLRQLDVVAADLATPTDFDFLHDGRMLVAERSGLVKLLDSQGSPSGTVHRSSPEDEHLWLQGLMTVAVDPDFARTGTCTSPTHHVPKV